MRVWLGDMELDVYDNVLPFMMVAELPDEIVAGTYQLRLTRANGASWGWQSSLDVALGAVGPQGEAGPAGPMGPEGPTGPEGDPGPMGQGEYAGGKSCFGEAAYTSCFVPAQSCSNVCMAQAWCSCAVMGWDSAYVYSAPARALWIDPQ